MFWEQFRRCLLQKALSINESLKAVNVVLVSFSCCVWCFVDSLVVTSCVFLVLLVLLRCPFSTRSSLRLHHHSRCRVRFSSAVHAVLSSRCPNFEALRLSYGSKLFYCVTAPSTSIELRVGLLFALNGGMSAANGGGAPPYTR
jgi:hypothetical protein